jgi:hypothetical protein
MAEVIMTNKQNRVRCSDEDFLTAVYTSSTYAEVAEKTGQKIASTMARYSRVKKALAERGETLPEMQRKKPIKSIDNIDNMVEIVRRLKAHHSES